jgi:phage-related protein
MNAKATARPKAIVAKFWKAASGENEPVRAWLLNMAAADRKDIGGDIHRVETEWPNVGLPLVRALGGRLFEVRSSLADRIARVIFAVDDGTMVLLHGFIKKTQATPKHDLDLARDRWSKWQKARK